MFDLATVRRLVRYGLVGIATNLAGYALYLVVTHVGLGPKLTMTLLYVAGATFGYVGNRQWAFRHTGSVLHSSTGYVLAHAGGYLLNFALLHVFVDRLGYPHEIVQGFAILLVAGYLFLVLNLLVFKGEKAGGAAS